MQNPKTTEYEFAGPIGAAGISFATPFFAYALYFFCNEKVGCSALPRYPDVIFKQMLTGVKDSFFDAHAWGLYLAWYAFTVACWAALPGKWEKGTELRNGKRLEYKTNGECMAFSSLDRGDHVLLLATETLQLMLTNTHPCLTTLTPQDFSRFSRLLL